MLKLKNNATAPLGASLNTSATTLTLASNGALFPTLSAGEWFPITVISASNPANFEIMRVTARSNNVMTVQRAQEGTSAKAFSAGDIVDLRLTSGALEEGFPRQVDTAGSKSVQFSLAALSSGATRTINVPDKDVDLDLGSASKLDVVNSNIDGSPGKAVTTGYGGIGRSAVQYSGNDIASINDIENANHFFAITNTDSLTDMPSGWAASDYPHGINTYWTSAVGAQILFGRAGNKVAIRQRNGSNTHGQWAEFHTSANLNFSLSGTTLTITKS